MEALNYQDASHSESQKEIDEKLNDKNVCMICLEKMDKNTHLTLKCNHIFHTNCILNSYKSSAVRECPYCRTAYELSEYTGGIFLNGFHKKNSLQKFLNENTVNDDSETIEWDTLTDKNLLWIKKGVNGMQKGSFVKMTPSKNVYLKLDDGRTIRTIKHNLLLLKISNS